MVATFLQKKKIQHLLILVLGVVIFITAAVIWWGFFTTGISPGAGVPLPLRSAKVDISILSHPFLLELDEPRAKTQIPLKVGRKNPLLPFLQ